MGSRVKKREMSEKNPLENEKQGKNKRNERKNPPEHKKQGKNKRNGRKNPHHKLLSDEKMYKTKI